MSYLNKHTNKQLIPPTHRLTPDQVKNDGGGYAYKVDKWTMLNRFLVIGAEGGTYYVGERKQVGRNLDNLRACLKEDGPKTVKKAVEISLEGRALKNDQAILVLALASVDKNTGTRLCAFHNLHKVCRIGTHLYQFVEFRKNFEGGWGSGAKKAISSWFTEKDANKLAYQVAKYKQREGWSARDLLRLSHPVPPTPEHEAIFSWVCGEPGTDKDENVAKRLDRFGEKAVLPKFLAACDAAQAAEDAKRIISLIQEYNLPREAIPTHFLNDKGVWEALLKNMPLTAMIRNLGKMSSIDLLTAGSEASRLVAQKLTDKEALKRGRIHPINMLMAMKVYQQGHGQKGNLTWEAVRTVVDAMDDSFYLCFDNVEPTGKPTIVALDISGSMSGFWGCQTEGILTPREITAAMAMVTMRTEKEFCTVMGFSTGFIDLGIGRRDSLSTVTKKISGLPFSSTNCSEPMLWALENKVDAEAFIIYTDNDVNAGRMHPSEALKKHRRETGRDSKMIVCATIASNCSIADPNDPHSLDIAGFDAATPVIINNFVAGRF